MSDPASDLIEQMHDLLDRERIALMRGQLEEVGRLFELKQSLIDRIGSSEDPDRDDLETVHTKVIRNQALLNGAMEGIRAVSDRISEMQKVKQGLDTYDKSGRRFTIGKTAQGQVKKRA